MFFKLSDGEWSAERSGVGRLLSPCYSALRSVLDPSIFVSTDWRTREVSYARGGRWTLALSNVRRNDEGKIDYTVSAELASLLSATVGWQEDLAASIAECDSRLRNAPGLHSSRL